MKLVALVLVILLSAGIAFGCDIPGCTVKPRHNPLKSKKFWAETAITLGFAAWDAESTVRNMRRCPTCVESNGIFSARPTRRELYAKGGAIIAGERLIIGLLWAHPKTYPVGYTLSTFAAGAHVVVHSVLVNKNNKLGDWYERKYGKP